MDGAAHTPSERQAKIRIDRAWLQGAGELEIADGEPAIAPFVEKVAGSEHADLTAAVAAIVRQAKREMKTATHPRRALLVCREYHMKWRGARPERQPAAAQPPKNKKARYGLFLVRECARCPKGSQGALKAFRVHAYALGKGGRRYEYHAKGERSTGHTCKRATHNDAEPWNCACCKHLYCRDHGDSRKLKAACLECTGLRWRRRSKSKSTPGEFLEKRRSEEDSYYEPVRPGMYFTDAALTNDLVRGEGGLLAAYGGLDAAARLNPEGPARNTRSASRARAAETARSVERRSELVDVRVASDQPVTENETADSSAYAPAPVPRITIVGVRRSARRRAPPGSRESRFV
jgi:hypothetical protein